MSEKLTPEWKQPMSNARDCVHGSLARKCEICDRDQEIHNLKAELEQSKLNEARAGGMLKQACGELERVKKERDKANQDANELNGILRRAGWGQGEIDSCWSLVEEAERQRNEARKLAMGLAGLLVRVRRYIPENAVNATKALSAPVDECYTADEVKFALAAFTEAQKGWEK